MNELKNILNSRYSNVYSWEKSSFLSFRYCVWTALAIYYWFQVLGNNTKCQQLIQFKTNYFYSFLYFHFFYSFDFLFLCGLTFLLENILILYSLFTYMGKSIVIVRNIIRIEKLNKWYDFNQINNNSIKNSWLLFNINLR